MKNFVDKHRKVKFINMANIYEYHADEVLC